MPAFNCDHCSKGLLFLSLTLNQDRPHSAEIISFYDGVGERRQLQGELKTLRPLGICLSDGPHHRVVVESPLSVHLRKTWTLLPFELLSHCGQAALRNRRERKRAIERES